MTTVDLSRLQFGSTIIYHFLFVPLTLGLVVLVALMETLYVITKNDMYKRMTLFWGQFYLISFAMGVVTGIVQEFQFGMNWANFSRYVGDIFGAPLAIEGLLAFFLESVFLGIWMFSWNILPRAVHALMIWLVALGEHLSAFWILGANSFMQHPVGYVQRNNRLELTDFGAFLQNNTLWMQFPHVIMGAWALGGFFVLGISAFHLAKREKHRDFFKKSFLLGTIVALIGTFMVGIVGHEQAKLLGENQPMKLAAASALWESENPAGEALFAIALPGQQRNLVEIRIPYLLTILDYNSLQGEVEGLIPLQQQYEQRFGPGNYIPPVNTVYWGFHLMVYAWGAMMLIALYAAYLLIRNKLHATSRLLALLPLAIIMPYVAIISGWVMTEVGRQPFIVYGLLSTVEGVSPTLKPSAVITSLLTFAFLYTMLAGVTGYLMFKYARNGVDEIVKGETKQENVPVTIEAAY